jgi:hypothetical protein
MKSLTSVWWSALCLLSACQVVSGLSSLEADLGATGVPCTGQLPSGVPCDVVTQCGCEAGEKCAYLPRVNAAGMPVVECQPAGATQPYTACTGDDCGPGYECIGGACKRYCESVSATCDGIDTRCFRFRTVDMVQAGFVCSRTCNLVDPTLDDNTFDACGPGTTCVDTESGSDCFETVGLPEGAACEEPFECAAGLSCQYCSEDQSVSCCRSWCEIGGSTCGAGRNCNPFRVPVFVAGVQFGLCAL